MASKYTAEDKQRIREHYIETGRNALATARDLGIPRSTVRAVALGLTLSASMATDEDVTMWQEASQAVAQRIAELAPVTEDLSALAAAARAATAAHLDYRDGRKGAGNTNINVDNRSITIEHVSDWRG